MMLIKSPSDNKRQPVGYLNYILYSFMELQLQQNFATSLVSFIWYLSRINTHSHIINTCKRWNIKVTYLNGERERERQSTRALYIFSASLTHRLQNRDNIIIPLV